MESAQLSALIYYCTNGSWRQDQRTSLGYSLKSCCIVGWKRLQNGHSRSEYSTTVTLAFCGPRTWSSLIISRISPTVGSAGCAGAAALPSVLPVLADPAT